MPSETHIVRFKVVSVECAAMPTGKQYTVFYRRGSTARSSPCFVAKDGVVDFRSMPEGAALIHFKSGSMGRRYAPKYIQFRIEEYTHGNPRQTVGEMEVDCAEVVNSSGISGSGIRTVFFVMYGKTAKITVAMLVYPERAPPLSFDHLITPAGAEESKVPAVSSDVRGDVKVMSRGEAMTLLISVEAMLERRGDSKVSKGVGETKLEKRLHELEIKRKSMAESEGLANAVVTARAHEIVAAQFTALAHKYRNNFIGATAAYLRQMALTSGTPYPDEAETNAVDESSSREQLKRIEARLDELRVEKQKLERDQVSLGRIQGTTDVAGELHSNREKVSTIESQMKVLQRSKDSLTTTLRGHQAVVSTPLGREVSEITNRVKTLEAEQEQLREKIRHMTMVAAGHVLSWSRSKNPPTPAVTTNVDDLFSDLGRDKEEVRGSVLAEDQRMHILNAFQTMKPTAPPETARSLTPSNASSSSGHRTPRNLFAGTDLPSMGDFGTKSTEEQKPKSTSKKGTKGSTYHDPLVPDLGRDMFSAERREASITKSADFTASANAPQQMEHDLGGEFVFGASSAPTAPFSVGFTLDPVAEPAVTNTMPLQQDNPYYDDMDDFTVLPDTATGVEAMVEFTGNFVDFGEPVADAPTTNPAIGAAAGAPAARPTFNFGPMDNSTHAGRDSSSTQLGVNPSYDFGMGTRSGDVQSPSKPALPTYNFGIE